MEFLRGILRSKKVRAALAAVTIAGLTELGLDPEAAEMAVKALMAYIAAQGIVDLGLALKGKKEV